MNDHTHLYAAIERLRVAVRRLREDVERLREVPYSRHTAPGQAQAGW